MTHPGTAPAAPGTIPAASGASGADWGGRDWPSHDWEAVRASGDIQFAPVVPKPPAPSPEWLKRLGEWLRDLFEPLARWLGLSWPVLEKLLLGLAALAVLALLWRLARPILARLADRSVPAIADWAPDRAEAMALLEDADRLALAGQFDAATHLLLRRSVHHIATAHPDWLAPASTAREIAGLPGLPERARVAFALIAGRVERSLFALRALDAADWQAARAAYADFAVGELAG